MESFTPARRLRSAPTTASVRWSRSRSVSAITTGCAGSGPRRRGITLAEGKIGRTAWRSKVRLNSRAATRRPPPARTYRRGRGPPGDHSTCWWCAQGTSAGLPWPRRSFVIIWPRLDRLWWSTPPACSPGDGRIDPLVVKTMGRRGFHLRGYRSTTLTQELLAAADLVVGMDASHVAAVAALSGEKWSRAFTLRELVRRQ